MIETVSALQAGQRSIQLPEAYKEICLRQRLADEVKYVPECVLEGSTPSEGFIYQ